MVDAIRRLMILTGLWRMITRQPTKMFEQMQNEVDQQEERCERCYYFRPLDKQRAIEMGMTGNIQFGNCHFNPPTVQGFGRTDVAKFCSKFKERLS